MVPFYGQGLNCGLEDVRVLMNILRSEGALQSQRRVAAKDEDRKEDVNRDIERAFQRYTRTRHDDLVAIRDLAMDN